MWQAARLSRLQHLAMPGLGRLASQHTLCCGCLHSLKLDHRLGTARGRPRGARLLAQAAVVAPELEKAEKADSAGVQIQKVCLLRACLFQSQ